MFFLCSRLGPFRLYTVGKKSLIQIKQTIHIAIKNWYFYIRISIFEKFRRMAFSIASNDFFDYFRFCYDKVNSNSDFFEKTHPKMVLKVKMRLFRWCCHHCAVALGWRTLAVCVVYCRCRSAARQLLLCDACCCTQKLASAELQKHSLAVLWLFQLHFPLLPCPLFGWRTLAYSSSPYTTVVIG